MRILIQNCVTHQYLGKDNHWQQSSDTAKIFRSTERAMAFCMEKEIPRAQIVLKFESEEYDVELPVSDECRQRKKPVRAA